MNIEKDMAYLIAIVVLIVGFFAYAERAKNCITVQGIRYEFVGIATLPGNDIYTPVYKRIQ